MMLRKNNMRTLIGLIMLSGFASFSAAQEATFRFSPPDGALISIKSRRETLDMKTGMNEPSKDVENSLQEMRVHKVPEGYQIMETYRDLKDVINGKPWTNPMLPVVIGMTNASVVSSKGLFLSIQNTSEVSERIKKFLPSELALSAGKQFNPAALKESGKLHWLQIYGVLAGKTLHQGDTFVTNFVSTDSGESSALYYLSAVTNFNGKPIALIRYFVSSDKADIASARAENVIYGTMDAFFKLPVEKFPNQRTAGERWMFCETMLLLREQSIEQTRWPGRRRTLAINRTFELK
jgi:hypothetical protein